MMLAAPSMPEVDPRAALKILIADDVDLLRSALRALVLRQGHQADVVSNGREALAAAEARDFDLILLDLEMPVMGGLEAAARLRARRGRSRPRLVGMSADPEHARAMASGMDAFLAKPVRLDDLLGVLEHIGRR